MWTIHSSGDAAFLEQILIAVAMVTSVPSFEKMVAVGFLIGVIMVMMQSMMQGAREINVGQILIAYLLYAMFFIPTVTVLIEDNYTGEVRVVDNVPLAVGAGGGLISTIGYGITKIFEQGYGVIVPYTTESSFAEPLKILNDTRKRISTSAIFPALESVMDGHFQSDWNNYIRDCTMTAIDLGPDAPGGFTLNDVMSKKLPESLKFESRLYRTEIGGFYMTCSDAYGVLADTLRNALSSTEVSDALLAEFGVPEGHAYAGQTGQQKITSSLGMLGQVSTSGTDYLLAAVLEPIYYQAAQGKYQDFQDVASATMLGQALQQRNTQWAAEQSMFMTIARPLMTFFEGFVYAITPLMAFLIMLGAFGIGLVGKYFQTLIWIQLWLPVMSIINLYTVTSASNQLSSIGGSEGLSSFYALSRAEDVLQHWIGVGGMLFAATPVITLFVVSGSAYALTSLASGLKGSDHVDEKIQSKDLMTNGPVMQASASNQYSDLHGQAATGAEAMIGTISFGSGMGKMVNSTNQNMQQSQEAFSETLGNTLSQSASDGNAYASMGALGRTHTAAHGTTEGIVNQRANQIMANNSQLAEHGDAVRGVVQATLAGAISADAGAKALKGMASASVGGSIKGGLSAVGTSETTDTTKTSAGNSVEVGDALTFTSAEQSQGTNSLAQTMSRTNTGTLAEVAQNTDTHALLKSAQDVNSSSAAYSEAKNMSQNAQSMNNLNLQNVGAAIKNNPEASSQLNDYWNTGGVGEETKQEAQGLYELYTTPGHLNGYGMESGTALAAARVKALQNSNNHAGVSDEQYQQNFGAAVKATASSLNLNSGEYGGYDKNAGIKSVDNGNLSQRAGAAAQNADNTTQNAKNIAMPESGFPPTGDPISFEQPEAIRAEENKNAQRIEGSREKEAAARYEQQEEPARQQLEHNSPEYSRMSAAELYGGVSNAGDWAKRRAEETGAYAENFDQRLNEIQNDPVLRKEAIEAAKMSDEQFSGSGFANAAAGMISKGAREVLATAAMGIELAKGNIGMKELSNYTQSASEQGAIYQAALAHASEMGEAAKFEEDHSQNFQQMFREQGISRGLTPEQAAVYATSYDSGGMMKFIDPNAAGNTPERQEAISNLAATYAQRDDDGNILMKNGAPVLSEKDQEFVDKMVVDLTEAARAPSNVNASYLTGISGYNNRTGRTNPLE